MLSSSTEWEATEVGFSAIAEASKGFDGLRGFLSGFLILTRFHLDPSSILDFDFGSLHISLLHIRENLCLILVPSIFYTFWSVYVLLEIKKSFRDVNNVLYDWTDSPSSDYYMWRGVCCDNVTFNVVTLEPEAQGKLLGHRNRLGDGKHTFNGSGIFGLIVNKGDEKTIGLHFQKT